MMTAVSLTKILRFQDSYNAISRMLNQQNFNFVLKVLYKKKSFNSEALLGIIFWSFIYVHGRGW